MKKIAAFLLIFATWYFAGMNRHAPMMATMLCALLVIVVSFVLSRALRGKIDADIPAQKTFAFKDAQTPFVFHIQNRSRLPVNHFRLSFSMKYRSQKKRIYKRLYGSAAGKNDKESSMSEFYFTAPYCGLIDVSLHRIRVYDYFRLFSTSKKLHYDSAQIYVLPFPKNVKIDIPYLLTAVGEPNAQVTSDAGGDDFSEIRLIREYRDGDLMRHIHRNYSARSGKLWIKEYYRDNDRKINVYLNTSSKQPLSADLLDAYYELVSSVLTSCVKYGLSMRINWLDAESGQAREYELRCSDDVSALLAMLYCTNTACSPEAFAAVFGDTDSGMVLSASLQWIFGGVPVFTFDKKTLSAQLESRVFVLGR